MLHTKKVRILATTERAFSVRCRIANKRGGALILRVGFILDGQPINHMIWRVHFALFPLHNEKKNCCISK